MNTNPMKTAPTPPISASSNNNHSLGRDTYVGGPIPRISGSDLIRKANYELSVSEGAVKKAIEKANKALAGEPSQFQYSVHGNDIIVKVINSETKEVIREIPPEKLIDLIDKLQELAAGAVIDERR